MSLRGVAVGMPVPGTPRTDPRERISRTGLLDSQAFFRIRVIDATHVGMSLVVISGSRFSLVVWEPLRESYLCFINVLIVTAEIGGLK